MANAHVIKLIKSISLLVAEICEEKKPLRSANQTSLYSAVYEYVNCTVHCTAT